MALVVNDRVKETSTTTGTGTFTLDGAVTGFETFSSAIGNSNTTYYAIEIPNSTEFEVGLGTVSAGTLARTTVISSSNSDALVDFSAGTKNVFCTLPASKAVIEDASNNVTLPADLTVGTDTFHVDSTNEKVSIGTTLGSYTGLNLFKKSGPGNIYVHLNGNPGTIIGTSLLSEGTSGDFIINTRDNADIRFYTNNTLRSEFKNNGNFYIDTDTLYVDAVNDRVGIGTSSPTYTLESLGSGTDGAFAVFHNQGSGGVYSGVQIASDNQLGGGNSDTNLIMTRWNGVGTKVAAVKLGVVQNNNDGVLTFSTAENADLGSSTYTERMRIDGDTGNIGIGTTSPSTLLHLSSSDPQITITDTDGTGSQVIKAVGDDLVLDSPSNIKFDADSAGNVWFMDGGTTFLKVYKFGGTKIEANVADEDLIFKVNDGGSFIDVLTFDSSEAGAATFNDKIILGANKAIEFGDAGESISGDGTDMTITGNIVKIDAANRIILDAAENRIDLHDNGSEFARFVNNGGQLRILTGSSAATAVSFDSSGAATFNSSVTVGANLDVSSGTIKLDGNFPTGTNNVAMGDNALNSLTTGQDNTCIGHDTGTALQDGSDNTFIGESAGAAMTSGNTNTAVGGSALKAAASVSNTVAIGQDAGLILTSGDRNTFVGRTAGSTANGGNNNICLGYNAEPSSASINNEITLGDAQVDRFRIPGLQSGASSGDVLTYDGTKIVLSTPSTGVSAGFAVAMAIAL